MIAAEILNRLGMRPVGASPRLHFRRIWSPISPNSETGWSRRFVDAGGGAGAGGPRSPTASKPYGLLSMRFTGAGAQVPSSAESFGQ